MMGHAVLLAGVLAATVVSASETIPAVPSAEQMQTQQESEPVQESDESTLDQPESEQELSVSLLPPAEPAIAERVASPTMTGDKTVDEPDAQWSIRSSSQSSRVLDALQEMETQLKRQTDELTALRDEVSELKSETLPLPAPVISDSSAASVEEVEAALDNITLSPPPVWVSDWLQTWAQPQDVVQTLALALKGGQVLTDESVVVFNGSELSISDEKRAELLLMQQLSARESETQSQAAEQMQLTALQQKVSEQAKELEFAQAELASLKQKSVSVTQEELQENEQTQISYAAGNALGLDIADMIKERLSWGVDVKRQALLAGMLDAINGTPQLERSELESLITRADDEAAVARGQAIEHHKEQDKVWLDDFISQKGVKASPTGFWFRVDESGKKRIPENAVVDLVVKETLTDGTVIQDMAKTGRVLSQPLYKLPPLFREAIEYLRINGKLTMAVPPELAYGDKGYPPQILPGATMVYELEVKDAKPEK